LASWSPSWPISAAVAIVAIKPWATNPFHPTKTVRYFGIRARRSPYPRGNRPVRKRSAHNRISYRITVAGSTISNWLCHLSKSDAVTVVQIDPKISRWRASPLAVRHYLRHYAAEVPGTGNLVIRPRDERLWYSWANQHSSASDCRPAGIWSGCSALSVPERSLAGP
jgi:hypothetical protein